MICVVGALAVDLLVSRDHFHKGTSNPASIRLSPGGVGYRIYSHLEVPKMLFTALGSDVFGKWLIESMDRPQGVHPLFLDQHATACYCALMQSGELLYGAADMEVIEQGLSWPRLRARLPELGKSDFLVLEANLSPDLVRSLIRSMGSKTRIVFESVSVEKLLRHAEVLKNLYLLSGNEAELRALGERFAAGKTSNDPGGERRGPALWAQSFLEQRNIQQLLITHGRRGVHLYRRQGGGAGEAAGGIKRMAPLAVRPGRVLKTPDTTGAGDRLLSAYLEEVDREPDIPVALQRAVATVEKSIEEESL